MLPVEAEQAIADAAEKQEKAEEEAQNAKELKRYVDASTALAEMSETDTEALINTGLPGDRSIWDTRQWAIYTLRRMMYVVDALSYEDVQTMQEILIKAENPEKSQAAAVGQEGGEA